VHLLPAFGELRLDEIGPREIEVYKAEKDGHCGASTINQHLSVLLRVLSIAHEWGLIEPPCRVRKLKITQEKVRFLGFGEAKRLIEHADDYWRAMIVVAAKAGLRIGELCALRWEDVDFDAGVLTVQRSAWRGIVGTTKSGKSRTIPMCKTMVRSLRDHRQLSSGELIFSRRSGAILTQDSCRRPLDRAACRADIPHLGWHVLRHTFASHLAMRGVSMRVIQQLLGHASIEMTMRYAHLSPAMHRNAVDLLDSENGNSVAKKSAEDAN